jgi:purine-cytosine permease-like protein
MSQSTPSRLAQQLAAVEEYERTPIPAGKLKSTRSFWGMYAAEHTAGTEFVIGPLFVAHGVSAPDLVWGLLVGNLLAVLSWALLTAPIATQKRMTLYYQLERIAGRRLTNVYNVINALMFCFLAGSMIAVSATAVGIPFDMAMPSLGDWLPGSLSWVVIVMIVGLVTTVVAMFGYEQVSRFAGWTAPFLIAIFLYAGLNVLPELGVSSLADFWPVANEVIWTGTPMAGQSQFTFWHVMCFAWIANMAMHIGMADLSILRYAKTWKAGLASSAGMFIGHYLAWMASGILYALFLLENAGSTEFAPGPVAYRAAGILGALCVIFAGWTTANPTIYRAGLALQAIAPNWKTWKVTLVVGLITSVAACFPALVMKLLDFVALYGLVLMPMGAVIFMDFHVIPRIGLQPEWAWAQRRTFNLAVALSWGLTLLGCLLLNLLGGVEIFFLGLPGWLGASALYLGLSRWYQRQQPDAAPLPTTASVSGPV